MISIETGTGDVTVGFAARPSDETATAVRAACQRLVADEAAFVRRFAASLLTMVNRLHDLPDEQGRSLAEGLGRAVLWAALTDDDPEVVEATFRNIGADNARVGFPPDGYHSAGHALLRAVRDTYTSDWTSELSSGWVAFYGWLGPELQQGASAAQAEARRSGVPLPGDVPADRLPPDQGAFHVPGPAQGPPSGPVTGPFTGPFGGPPTGSLSRPPGPPTGPLTGPLTGPPTGPLTGPLTAPGAEPPALQVPAARPTTGQLPAAQVPAQPAPGPADAWGPEPPVGEPQIGRLLARGLPGARPDGAPDASRDAGPRARPPASAPPAPAQPAPWEPPRWERPAPARREPSRWDAGARAADPAARGGATGGLHLAPAPVTGGAPAPVAARPSEPVWADLAPAAPPRPPDAPAASLTDAIAEGGPRSLDEVLDLVRSRFFLGNERALGAVLTRVALRTGADLRAPRPDQRSNPAVVANVLAVLQVMGYPVQPAPDALQVVLPGDPRATDEPQHWWTRRTGPAKGWRRRSHD